MGIFNCSGCGQQLHIAELTYQLCGMCTLTNNLHGSSEEEQKEDIINWPKHYNTGSIQPIDVIEDWKLDFRLANALKYLSRAGKKNPDKLKEDLEKAVWYINRYIEKECNK